MSRKVAFYGIFAALAVLMGYVEMIVPSPVPIPGVKLGFANVIVLIALYFMGGKAALGINIIRVMISALLFNGFSGLLFSIAGAAVSYIAVSYTHLSYIRYGTRHIFAFRPESRSV